MNSLRINVKNLILLTNKLKYSIAGRDNIITKSITTSPTGGLNLVEQIIESADEKLYIAWHPTQDFPYECSRPIPELAKRSSSEIIKEEAILSAMVAFKNKNPEFARQELMKITFTTKHRWYPRARDKKAKNTPMDRKYL